MNNLPSRVADILASYGLDGLLEVTTLADVAQEIIAAIRAPTNAMCNAGTRCLAVEWEITADGRVAPDVWAAMIGACDVSNPSD